MEIRDIVASQSLPRIVYPANASIVSRHIKMETTNLGSFPQVITMSVRLQVRGDKVRGAFRGWRSPALRSGFDVGSRYMKETSPNLDLQLSLQILFKQKTSTFDRRKKWPPQLHRRLSTSPRDTRLSSMTSLEPYPPKSRSSIHPSRVPEMFSFDCKLWTFVSVNEIRLTCWDTQDALRSMPFGYGCYGE